jgi:hypothetical protein
MGTSSLKGDLTVGGLREDTIETGTATPSPKGKGKTAKATVDSGGQSIRIHEDDKTGQVHFHVDKEKLKVAMPVATWWKIWEKLSDPVHSSPQNYVEYVDETNKSILYVDVTQQTDPGFINASLKVSPLKGTNPIYDQLKKFSEAKG